MMPNKNQTELNQALYDAIAGTAFTDRKKALADIEELLNCGADPTAIVTFHSTSNNVSRQVQPISAAIRFSDYDIIREILKHSKHPIDLSTQFITTFPMPLHRNILQETLATCPIDISKLLLKYGKDTKQDLFAVCNQDIEVHFRSSTEIACLMDLIVFSITAGSLMSEYRIHEYSRASIESGQAVSKQLNLWEKYTPINPIQFKSIEPIHLKFQCRSDVLQILFAQKLIDKNANSITGNSLAELLSLLDLSDKNETVSVDTWFLAFGVLYSVFSNMKISPDEVSCNKETGEITISKAVSGRTGQAQQPLVIHILPGAKAEAEAYFTPEVTATADPAVTQQVAELTDAVNAHRKSIDRVKTRITETEQLVALLPSVRRTKFRECFKEHDTAVKCFDSIYDLVHDDLFTYHILKTGMVTAKTTDTTAKIVNLAQRAFSIAIQSTNVPGADIVPLFTGWLAYKYDQLKQNQTIDGVTKATDGLEIASVAVDVAALIAYQVQLVNGKNTDGNLIQKLKTYVQGQIKLLGTLIKEGASISHDEAVGFIANKAMLHFQAIEHPHRRKSHSQGSSSDGSHSTPIDHSSHSGSDKLVVAAEDQPNKSKNAPKRGGCCSIS